MMISVPQRGDDILISGGTKLSSVSTVMAEELHRVLSAVYVRQTSSTVTQGCASDPSVRLAANSLVC
jgi:hypothetical protein